MQLSEIRWELAAAALMVAAVASSAEAGFQEEYEAKKWEEIEVQLPAMPAAANLIPFYVSAATDNRFFVDGPSLSVDKDGVVRYVLVIETSGGARNVSYEGMRCETKERRMYASGRADGSWSKSRNNRWEPVREAVSNRYHAALFLDYFCPGGAIVWTADEARDALRKGGHPSLKRF